MKKRKWWTTPEASQSIDWVVQSVKDHTSIWQLSRQKVPNEKLYNCAWQETVDSIEAETFRKASNYSLTQFKNLNYSARIAAQGAIFALIAYNDRASDYLSLPKDQLEIVAKLTNHPSAWLILPASMSRQMIEKLN